MGAILGLMLLVPGAAPALIEAVDAELLAAEIASIRKELITVRSELRRVKAQAIAVDKGDEVRLRAGVEGQSFRDALAKDAMYKGLAGELRELKQMVRQFRLGLKEGAGVVKHLRELESEVARVTELMEKRAAEVSQSFRQERRADLMEKQVFLEALEKVLLADLKRLTRR